MKNINILLLCCTLAACSTVKKHSTITTAKSDSSIVKVNDIAATNTTDSSSNKQTIVGDETVVNVEFEGDTAKEQKPISIAINKGLIEVNAGGRKIKAITATAKNNVDSSTKTTATTTQKLVDKSTTKTEVQKENKAIVIDKKTIRFSMFWLLWLLLIPIAYKLLKHFKLW